MTQQDENTQLLKQYEKILKMLEEHMKTCPQLEKEVIEGFDFKNG